jgi:hypothetical protein
VDINLFGPEVQADPAAVFAAIRAQTVGDPWRHRSGFIERNSARLTYRFFANCSPPICERICE